MWKLLWLVFFVGCAGRAPKSLPNGTVTIIGTTDLHGHLERLPVLGGLVHGLRQQNGQDSVLLVDSGDVFQGTYESNRNEGAALVRLYNQLGYDALAIGNHEFDYGPVGPKVVAGGDGDDPVGAIKQRAVEATFPFLAANLLENGGTLSWPNVRSSIVIRKEDLRIGVIGVTTMGTKHTTRVENVAHLELKPLAATIQEETSALKKQGAHFVIVLAHVGGSCKEFADPDDVSSCKEDSELFKLARELEFGEVDVILGGHSHSGVAHRVNGIVLAQAYSKGTAFSKVELTMRNGERNVRVFSPTNFCTVWDTSYEACQGQTVDFDKKIAQQVDVILAKAQKEKARPLGVEVKEEFIQRYDVETPLGNLIVQLMLDTWPQADVALTNAGGIRAPLAPGPLTYGEWYAVNPFDNGPVLVTTTVGALREIVRKNLIGGRGIFHYAGLRVVGKCVDGALNVELTDDKGKPLLDNQKLRVVTSDFLAGGGDGGLGANATIEPLGTRYLRDAVMPALKARKSLNPSAYPLVINSPRHCSH